MNKKMGLFLGSVVGDVLGAPLEFYRRDKVNITDISSGGILNMQLGEWTDDTSMSICLAESILEKGFDLEDQMKKYTLWYRDGKYCTREKCFDIGNATRFAIDRYIETGEYISNNLSRLSSGNGSIMRLSPIPIVYNCPENSSNFDKLMFVARESSKTTHPNETCQDACVFLSIILNRALNNESKENIFLFTNEQLNKFKIFDENIRFIALNIQKIKEKDRVDISSSGYVVHSLEAAIWSFLNNHNFNDSVLTAANLGDDADTVASITGQISGAYYGLNSINENWIDKIILKDYLFELSEKLYFKSINKNN